MGTGLAGMGLSLATSRMGNYYNNAITNLTGSLSRLASGKKILQPKDDIIGFLRLERLNQDLRGYEKTKSNLDEGYALGQTAEAADTSVMTSLRQMKELTLKYWQTSDADEKAAYKSDYEGLREVIDSAVNGSYFHGQDMYQAGTVASIMYDPNDLTRSVDLTLDAGDIIDITNLNIDQGGSEATALTEFDTQYAAASSHLVKTSSFMHSVETHLDLTNSQIDGGNEFRSSIEDVNEVEEMANVTKWDIRQQAALSMISQGNMYRMSVLKLIE